MAPKKENGDTERNGTILWWKPMKMAIKNEKDDINGNKKENGENSTTNVNIMVK